MQAEMGLSHYARGGVLVVVVGSGLSRCVIVRVILTVTPHSYDKTAGRWL